MSESTTNTDQEVGKRPKMPAAISFVDKMSDIFAVGAAVGAILLVLNIFIDVVGRKLFGTPFPGTLEHTANWWMPTLALLAFAYTEKQQEHIKVTVLLDALPLRMRQIIEGVFGVLATLLLVAVSIYTFRDAMQSYGYQEVTASSPPVAIWPFKFVALAGMAMIALQSAATTFRYFAGALPLKVDYDNEGDLG